MIIYTGKLTTLPASNEFTVKYDDNVIDNIKIHIKNLDSTKTAGEIYVYYNFKNLTDFLGKTYNVYFNNTHFLSLTFLMYKILIFSN